MLLNWDWRTMVYMIPAILFALTIHEFAHAAVAYKMGDETPLRQGRLTLNPLPHLDLFGFLMLLVVGFGWAKPVMIDPRNFKKPKMGEIGVSLAGPAANLVLAILFGGIFKLILTFAPGLLNPLYPGKLLSGFFVFGIWINLALAVFNILPVPPLDGSHLLFVLIPDKYLEFKIRFMQFGSVILMILLIVSQYSAVNLLPIYPATKFLFNGLTGMLGIH